MTTQIDLTQNPLQVLRMGYDVITDKRTIRAMIRYYKYLQKLLYEQTQSIFIAEQLQVAEVINSILSRYKSVKFSPKLIGNSANAKATSMNVFNLQDDTENIFLKFQVKQTADDIRTDAYNGFLIQHLMPNSPHYLETVDLFKTFVSTDDRWYLEDYIGDKLRIIIKDKRIQIATPSVFPFVADIPSILGMYQAIVKENDYKVATVLSAKQILGPSLHSIIYTLDKTNYHYYMDKLHNLFISMIHLGKHGFVHNDAHNNNILFNLEKEEFCLIDYGRVSFNPEYLNAHTKHLVNDYIQWNFLHTDANYLTQFIRFYNKTISAFANPFDYTNLSFNKRYINYRYVLSMTQDIQLQKLLMKWLVLFDISTITLGIYDLIATITPHQTVNEDIRHQFKQDFYDTDIIHITKDLIVIREFNKLSQLINTTSFVEDLKQGGLSVMLPGLIWTSFIFTSLHEVDPQNKIIRYEANAEALLIDRHLLKKNHYMHYYYQYSPVLLYNCRTTLFKYLPTAIAYIQKLLDLKSSSSQGGMMASRTSRIPMSVRSLRSNYLSKAKTKTSVKAKPSLPNGQLESVAEYNRTEIPPAELTDWLKNYRPLPVKLQPSNHLFGSLESFMEATRQKNARFHPLVEELKKYKPSFAPPKVSK